MSGLGLKEELRDGTTIRAYLDELVRLKSPVQMWLTQVDAPPLETTLVQVARDTFSTAQTLPMPAAQQLSLSFMIDARRFVAHTQMVATGVFRIPAAVAVGERRERFRASFKSAEGIQVFACERMSDTFLGGRMCTGRLVDLSLQGLRVVLDEVLDPMGEPTAVKRGDAFAALSLTGLPYTPTIRCAGVVTHVRQSGAGVSAGFRLLDLQETDRNNIDRILARRFPTTFGQAFPRKHRKTDLADQPGLPVATREAIKATEEGRFESQIIPVTVVDADGRSVGSGKDLPALQDTLKSDVRKGRESSQEFSSLMAIYSLAGKADLLSGNWEKAKEMFTKARTVAQENHANFVDVTAPLIQTWEKAMADSNKELETVAARRKEVEAKAEKDRTVQDKELLQAVAVWEGNLNNGGKLLKQLGEHGAGLKKDADAFDKPLEGVGADLKSEAETLAGDKFKGDKAKYVIAVLNTPKNFDLPSKADRVKLLFRLTFLDPANVRAASAVRELASRRGATPAQVALAARSDERCALRTASAAF